MGIPSGFFSALDGSWQPVDSRGVSINFPEWRVDAYGNFYYKGVYQSNLTLLPNGHAVFVAPHAKKVPTRPAIVAPPVVSPPPARARVSVTPPKAAPPPVVVVSLPPARARVSVTPPKAAPAKVAAPVSTASVLPSPSPSASGKLLPALVVLGVGYAVFKSKG